MKKIIGLFLILGIGTALLTSCFKAKYYGGRTKITGGNTFNIVSSNGIPTNINYTITETQIVQGASFEIKASNAIPVQLKAPTNSWNIQVTNPINVQLNQTGAIQANLTISNTPLRFADTNMAVSIGLKFDPALNQLLTNGFKVTFNTVDLEKTLHQTIATNWIIVSASTNFLNSYIAVLGKNVSNEYFPLIMSIFCILVGGVLGRTMGLRIGKSSLFLAMADITFILFITAIIGGVLLQLIDYGKEISRWRLFFVLVTAAVFILASQRCWKRSKTNYPNSVDSLPNKSGWSAIISLPVLLECFYGVIAALLVPAFARVVISNPLALSYQDPLSTIAFFTFCTLAGTLGSTLVTEVFKVGKYLVNKPELEKNKIVADTALAIVNSALAEENLRQLKKKPNLKLLKVHLQETKDLLTNFEKDLSYRNFQSQNDLLSQRVDKMLRLVDEELS